MDATVTTIVVGAVSAMFGTGGALAAYPKLRELRDRREESEIGRLRGDVARLEERHSRCDEKVALLTERLAAVEHHHTSYLARWIKDATKRVTWLNDRAYLSIFAPVGLSRAEVIGRTFSEMLDPSASAEIDRLDAAALAHPEIASSNIVQLHPSLPLMVVVKVAAIGREGQLIFEGYAYRTNDRMIADGQGASRHGEQLGTSFDRLLDRPPD